MEITRDTRVKDLMKEYPWMLEEAVKIDPQFAILKNPIAGAAFRRFSVADAARYSGLAEEEIMNRIRAMIAEHEGQGDIAEGVPAKRNQRSLWKS